jgi:hypothetical protein
VNEKEKQELLNALQFSVIMIGAYALTFVKVTDTLSELGTSFIEWRTMVNKAEQEYNTDLEKVINILKQNGLNELLSDDGTDIPKGGKGSEYLN